MKKYILYCNINVLLNQPKKKINTREALNKKTNKKYELNR